MLSMLFIGASSAMADKPNVVMILIDDMGWMDSSTYGSKYYQTPNLSRLAKEGMRFNKARDEQYTLYILDTYDVNLRWANFIENYPHTPERSGKAMLQF